MKVWIMNLLGGLFWGLGLWGMQMGEAAEQQSLSDQPTDYVLIITGDEVVQGVYADTHTQFITRTLGPLGCRCVASISVGDQSEHLIDALKFSDKHAALTIVTGGLGPTDADITRETLAQYTGIGLYENSEVVNDMKQRFAGADGSLRKNMLRQARIPEKGGYLRNPNGTAVGLIFDDTQKVIASLPGPPRELQPMVTNELIPFLSKRFGIHTVRTEVMMRFVGIGESLIDQTLHEKLNLPQDVRVAFKFEMGRVDLTFSLPGDTPKDLARLKELEKELQKYLGGYMYSDENETLEDSIIRLLAQRRATLATAEVGSGGAVAAGLNFVENASQHFWGGHIAPSNTVLARMLEIPQETLEKSEEETLAKTFAAQVCKQEHCEWAIAVTQVQIGENNSRFVWVALGSAATDFSTSRITLRGSGETMRNQLVTQILDLLRKKLML